MHFLTSKMHFLAKIDTLAGVLGIAVKNAIRLLDELVAGGIAVEVTHRAKRRLFALAGLAPLRDIVRPPYRPDPHRGRGQPRHEVEEALTDSAPVPAQPLTPLERHAFEYHALEEAMAHLDAVVRNSRNALRAVSQGGHKAEATGPEVDGQD
jgi:hypothetical protein